MDNNVWGLLVAPILAWFLWGRYTPRDKEYLQGVKAAEERLQLVGSTQELKDNYYNRPTFGKYCENYWEGYFDYIGYWEEREL